MKLNSYLLCNGGDFMGQEWSLQTKERILRAAEAEFAQKGFAGARFDGIAELSAQTKG